MEDYIQKEFESQLAQISDINLRKKVIDVSVEALHIGNDGNGWDNMNFPFTLLIPNLKITFADHVRTVTDLAIQTSKILTKQGIPIDQDILIAGALLHDVGKLLEYAKSSDGSIVKSDIGKRLRHPVTGAGLAMKHEIQYEVVQCIYQHSWEGERGPTRIPEGEIIHHCDFLHFGPLKLSMEKSQ
ncbi:MAG: HDIG domain-containing metalloprotein [Candidatus Hodarchaeota archaeon]